MKIRSFIAINLDETIKEKLKNIENSFREALPKSKIKWVKKDNFHITLRFLGDINQEDIPKIEDTIGEFAQECSAFTIDFHEVGVFPGIRRPRVLWIGGDYSDIFRDFYTGFNLKLESIGFPEDKPFLPHITFGRIKYIPEREVKILKELIDEARFNYKETVTHIDLMRSQLKPEGPIYTVIKTFYLK